MNIPVRIIRYSAFITALFALFAFFSPAAQAVGETSALGVVKLWEGEAELPESVRLYLKNGGQTVGILTLSADNALPDGSWSGSFENVPLYDAKGRVIQYSIDEEPIPGWELSVTQLPSAETLQVKSWGNKVTPASEKSYSVGQADMLVANKGGNYYVWTREALSEGQKSLLISQINAARLQGFGKELSLRNTDFQSGLPAAFEYGVSLRQDGQRTFVDFESPKVWSLFYTGSIELTRAQEARLVNRATAVQPTAAPTTAPTPTAAPTSPPTATPTAAPTPPPTATPTPVPSVQPTPLPTEPPRTGDTGISGVAVTLVLSLAAAGFILWKLRRG